jgi:hypothetical protein
MAARAQAANVCPLMKNNLRCAFIAKIASLSTHTRPHFRRSLSIDAISLWARGNHVNLGGQEVGTSDQASHDLKVSSDTTSGESFGRDGGVGVQSQNLTEKNVVGGCVRAELSGFAVPLVCCLELRVE